MLNISASRSWLLPTLSAIRLQAYLVQAILPGQEQFRFAQLPDVSGEEAAESFPRAGALEDFIASLEEKGDDRVPEVKKALQKWGKAELVDASFRVLGERYITPSSIVYLVVKLRLLSPSTDKVADEQAPRANESRDNEFLASRKDAEAAPQGEVSNIWAHAPYWPAVGLGCNRLVYTFAHTLTESKAWLVDCPYRCQDEQDYGRPNESH